MSPNSTNKLAERLAALKNEFDVLRCCPTPPGDQYEKYTSMIQDLNSKMTAFRAALDANPLTDVYILTVFQDFISLKNKFDEKKADLSKLPASLINKSPTHYDKLANMEPLGGGRSIRKKSASVAGQQVQESTPANISADEMLQSVAAMAQIQPPVQLNINQQQCKFANFYQVPGMLPMMSYMPPVSNTWMDSSNFADPSTQQFFTNPYPYMYSQQAVYNEQPILFQPPVEVVDLGDSDDEARKKRGAPVEQEQSVTATANYTGDQPTTPPAEPVPNEASEESMIEVLTKLGYNVSKSNTTKISGANNDQFSPCEIQIEDVTSMQNFSPPNFTNTEDLLMNAPDSEDTQGDCNGIPSHFSPPDSPISPTDLQENNLQMPTTTTNVAAKRQTSPPSNIYSFMQHANKPAPARQSQHRHIPPNPSPQNSRSVSFCSDASFSKQLELDKPIYTSPLEKIYNSPKHKITLQEYKERQQFGGSQNFVHPRPPPVDLMKIYFTDQGVSHSKSLNGHIASQSKPPNGLNPSPTKLKASKPEKIKAPVKSILKKHADVCKPPVKRQDSSSAAGSSRDSSQEKAKKLHVPEVFVLGPKTPQHAQTKSPVKNSPELIAYHDKEYYYEVNNEDKTRCYLCKTSYKHISRHFKDKHSAYEVLISRISTADLQLAEEDIKCGLIPPEKGQFQCRLCPEKITDLKHFKDHCTYHTGEYCYCCSECNFSFPYANDIKAHWLRLHSHLSDIPKLIEVDCIFPKPTALNKLFGYVCPVCHWLQLSKKSVEKHMIRNHGNDSIRNFKIKQINMVMHLPDEEQEAPSTAEPVVKKRGRKKKVVNYKDPEDVPKKKKKAKEMYKISTSSDETGLKLKFLKTKVPVQASPWKNKRTYVKHKQEDDNCACLGCGEIYSQTTKTTDWLECLGCKKWLHSDCSPYRDMCLQCGDF